MMNIFCSRPVICGLITHCNQKASFYTTTPKIIPLLENPFFEGIEPFISFYS